ncbi:MAG: SprT-like domain-containing protein [Pseudomonadota bacterium]
MDQTVANTYRGKLLPTSLAIRWDYKPMFADKRFDPVTLHRSGLPSNFVENLDAVCRSIAHVFFHDWTYPAISFEVTKDMPPAHALDALVYSHPQSMGRIRVRRDMLRRLSLIQISHALCHELAHIYVDWFSSAPDAHGSMWQSAMRACGLKPTPGHDGGWTETVDPNGPFLPFLADLYAGTTICREAVDRDYYTPLKRFLSGLDVEKPPFCGASDPRQTLQTRSVQSQPFVEVNGKRFDIEKGASITVTGDAVYMNGRRLC